MTGKGFQGGFGDQAEQQDGPGATQFRLVPPLHAHGGKEAMRGAGQAAKAERLESRLAPPHGKQLPAPGCGQDSPALGRAGAVEHEEQAQERRGVEQQMIRADMYPGMQQQARPLSLPHGGRHQHPFGLRCA